MIADEELLKLSSQGFIPGPGETESAFRERISYCLSLPNTLDNTIFEPLPEGVEKRLQEMYTFSLNWTPILYSNKELSFWHGGCAWIFQKENTLPKGAFFQLRRAYEFKNTFLGYSKDEILTHEATHVARMDFQEPIYEELLAYRTSENKFRRIAGPIVTTSYEVIIFMVSLFTLFISPWMVLLPIALILFAVLRLARRQKNLERLAEKISQTLIFRMTDKEIEEYSNVPVEVIREKVRSLRDKSPRNRLLYLLLNS